MSKDETAATTSRRMGSLLKAYPKLNLKPAEVLVLMHLLTDAGISQYSALSARDLAMDFGGLEKQRQVERYLSGLGKYIHRTLHPETKKPVIDLSRLLKDLKVP